MGNAPTNRPPDKATPSSTGVRISFENAGFVVADDMLYVCLVRLHSVE